MNVLLVSSLGSGCYKNDLAKDTYYLQKVQNFPNKKKGKAQEGSAAGLPDVRAKSVWVRKEKIEKKRKHGPEKFIIWESSKVKQTTTKLPETHTEELRWPWQECELGRKTCPGNLGAVRCWVTGRDLGEQGEGKEGSSTSDTFCVAGNWQLLYHVNINTDFSWTWETIVASAHRALQSSLCVPAQALGDL